MNRQVLAFVVIAVALVGAALTYFNGRTPPAPAPVTPVAPPVAAAPVTVPPPVATTPARPTPPAPVRPAPAAVSEPVPLVAPTTATLRITSDVPGAQVFIDRKFVGNAPVTAEDVAPGSRQINVSAPGYEGVAETLDVTPGPRDVLISLKTIRLDQSLAVTHKHRLGSCTGRLTATPDGLRYTTDNKDDGFAVPLTGLQTFTVDFAAKVLRVKITGGRSYDFADASAKPEPLYFFHQAVDKARQRLGGGL